ncbi:MAG: NifB/NifX family molybdenum-iron cluster-binding protein [Calditrichia bacterium]
MKIAFASNDQQTIAPHFGRSRGFLIVTVEDGQVKSKEYLENTFTGHALGLHHQHHHEHGGGHGGHHSRILNALKGCSVVISNGMGRRIYDDLNNAGITPMIVEERDIERALRAYLEGNLVDNPEAVCHH